MNIELCKMIWEDSPCEIAMAVEIKALTGQELVHYAIRLKSRLLIETVWITSRPEKVVNSSSFFVDSVIFQSIVDYRAKRAKKGKITPKPIINGDMSFLKLAGSCRPHPLPWILQTPQIQVSDLRSVHN